MKNHLILILLLSCCGCHSLVREGGTATIEGQTARVLLAPFHNATDDDYAARAMTEITASTLMDRNIFVLQSDSIFNPASAAIGQHELSPYFDEATRPTTNAGYILTGTVHEYRYKTDLDGDPVVGISMRLIRVETQEILWQGSASRVGVLFASLSSVSLKVVKDLVNQMPIKSR